jgi:hypothetical protein
MSFSFPCACFYRLCLSTDFWRHRHEIVFFKEHLTGLNTEINNEISDNPDINLMRNVTTVIRAMENHSSGLGWGRVELELSLQKKKSFSLIESCDLVFESLSRLYSKDSVSWGWNVRFDCSCNTCNLVVLGLIGIETEDGISLSNNNCKKCVKGRVVWVQPRKWSILIGTLGRKEEVRIIGQHRKEPLFPHTLIWNELGSSVGLVLSNHKRQPRPLNLSSLDFKRFPNNFVEDHEHIEILNSRFCDSPWCYGPKGHMDCNLRESIRHPIDFTSIFDILQLKVDLFADPFTIAKGKTFVQWFSEGNDCVKFGSGGDSLTNNWNGLSGWGFPPVKLWSEVVSKLKTEEHSWDDQLLVFFAPQEIGDQLVSVGFGLILVVKNPTFVLTNAESVYHERPDNGTWKVWVRERGVSADWDQVLRIVKTNRLWTPGQWLVRKVNILTKLNLWSQVIQEETRRHESLDEIRKACEKVQVASKGVGKGLARDYLFTLLSTELSIRKDHSDVEDLIDLAKRYLGKREEWWGNGSKAAEIKRTRQLQKWGVITLETLQSWFDSFSDKNNRFSLDIGTPSLSSQFDTILCRLEDPKKWLKRIKMGGGASRKIPGEIFTVFTRVPFNLNDHLTYFFDVGARDMLFKVKKTGPFKLRALTVSWEDWFRTTGSHLSKIPKDLVDHRDSTVNELILGKWLEGGYQDPTDYEMKSKKLDQQDTEGLPSVSGKFPENEVLKGKLVIGPNQETNFRQGVEEALLSGLSPTLAILESAQKTCETSVKKSLIPRKRSQGRTKSTPLLCSVLRILHKVKLKIDSVFTDPEILFVGKTFPSIIETFGSFWISGGHWTDLELLLRNLITDVSKLEALKKGAVLERNLRDLRDKKRKIWIENQSQALSEMTRKTTSGKVSLSLDQLVYDVRDKGRSSPNLLEDLSSRSGLDRFPTLHLEQKHMLWSTDCVTSKFDPVLNKIWWVDVWKQDTGQYLPQTSYFNMESLVTWSANLTIDDRKQWDNTEVPSIQDPIDCMEWPDSLNCTETIDLILNELNTYGRTFGWPTNNSGTTVLKIENGPLLSILLESRPVVNGVVPEAIFSCDGSGTSGLKPGEGGPSGFASIVLTIHEVFCILGGTTNGTSGLMEMAGFLESLRFIVEKTNSSTILGLGDYLGWVKTDLDEGISTNFVGHNKKDILLLSSDLLLDWKYKGGRAFWRHHTKAHLKKNQKPNWGNDLNTLVDKLASLGKKLVGDGNIHSWMFSRMNCIRWSSKLGLTRPVTFIDVKTFIEKRKSVSSDTRGITNTLVKLAGPTLWKQLVVEINNSLFKGEHYSEDKREVRGKNIVISKQDGGLRNILIPDCIGVVLEGIMSNRLNITLMDGVTVSKAQKCNIRGVAGIDENVFLFLLLILEFRNSALEGRLSDGECRIFLLNDLSSAFDRVLWSLLLHAISVVIKTDQPERFLMLIATMTSKVRIVVTVNGTSVVVGKNTGVPQGNPLSPLLFVILMEYARMITEDNFKPLVKIRSRSRTIELPIEIDYADDSNRVIDGLSEAQPVIDHIMNVLKAVDQTPNCKKIRVLGLIFREGHGVSTFDPNLTIQDSNGERVKIQPIERNEFFRVNGVWMNSLGSFKGNKNGSSELLEQRDSDTLRNIALSDYPVQAKLEALKMVADRQSEFLFSNTWFDGEELEEIDKLERKSIRSFFSLNLPNAYIKGELNLGLRKERHEIIYLSSFIKRLTSHDPRVKLLASLIIDSEPTGSVWELVGPLDPPFFHWSRIPRLGRTENGIREMGIRLAQLARNLGVGLQLEQGSLVITLSRDGTFHPLVNLGKLLKTLTKRSESIWLSELETRVSIDKNKLPPPEFSISWGDAGRKSLYRKQEKRFLSSRTFSDSELKILVGLRLLLWPTKIRDQVYTKRLVEGRCTCGSLQTTTHLLNIASNNTGHSLELRSFPTLRHDEWLSTIVKMIQDNDSGWEIIRGQDCTSSRNFVLFNDTLTESLHRKALNKSRDGIVHWKPDLILGKRSKTTLKVLLLDLCGGAPERLSVEDRLFKHLLKMGPDNPTDFTFDGELTTQGFNTLSQISGINPDDLRTLLETFTIFKTVRYSQRYLPLKSLIESLTKDFEEFRPLKTRVSISALAIGVTGTIPSFSVGILNKLFKKSQVPKVLNLLRNTTWNYAIAVYKSWRKER